MASKVLRTLVLLVAIFSTAGTGRTAAQNPFELGVDAGLELQGNGTDLDVVRFAIPVSAVRVARHMSPHVSVEATTSVSHVSFPDQLGSPSATSLGFSLAMLYHVGADASRPRLHGLLGVPFQYLRAAEDDRSLSDSEVGVLAGVGGTFPLADRLAARGQVRGIAWRGSRTSLSFLFGVSFFTR